MTLTYRAVVLHEPHIPLRLERIIAARRLFADVLVRIRVTCFCHTA